MHTHTHFWKGNMTSCTRLPWGWQDVSPRAPAGHEDAHTTITALDRAFAAKDTQVLYMVSGVLLAMIWALIITMYSVTNLQDSKNIVMAVFCLGLDVIAFLYAVRRIWLLKFLMVHPALGMLGQLNRPVTVAVTTGAYDHLLRGEAGIPLTNVFLGMMVACQAVAVVTLTAAAACLVGSNTAIAAGIGLAAASSIAFVASVVCYRKHAGVHLQQLKLQLQTPP